jgi:hypothetical protein
LPAHTIYVGGKRFVSSDEHQFNSCFGCAFAADSSCPQAALNRCINDDEEDHIIWKREAHA